MRSEMASMLQEERSMPVRLEPARSAWRRTTSMHWVASNSIRLRAASRSCVERISL